MGSVGESKSTKGLTLDWVDWSGKITSEEDWSKSNITREQERARLAEYTQMLRDNGAFGDWDISDKDAQSGMEWEWSEGMSYNFDANNAKYPQVPAVGLARWQAGAWAKGYGDDRQAFDKMYGISKFIDSHPNMQLNTNEPLYRGIRTTDEGLTQLKQAMQNGDTIDMRGPSSWSSFRGMAEQFTHTSIVGEGNPHSVVFVDTTKGLRNAIPYPFSGQAEVLTSASARYKISNIHERDGITYVVVQQTKGTKK